MNGKMTEWSKVYAWKAYKPQKGFVGSNPTLSARYGKVPEWFKGLVSKTSERQPVP